MKPIRQFLCNEADSYIHIRPEDSTVKISDCHRSATLWFDLYGGKPAIRKAIKKLNRLIDPLLKYKEYLEKKLEE